MPSTDAAALRSFLRDLPQVDRYILLLFYADGLSTAEIALVLELPQSRVESRLTALKAQAAAASTATPAQQAAPSADLATA